MTFNKIYDKYLELVENFFSSKNSTEIKKNSQYFTPFDEVDKMLKGLRVEDKDEIRILDPACGCGILIIKLLEYILKGKNPKKIIIDAYDIDPLALEYTEKILEEVSKVHLNIKINFINEDFLEEDNKNKYDYIITNPPYKKINMKLAPDHLKKYLNGQPNLYHLFIANSLKKLEEKGTLIVISPKSYLSGLYTEKLRKYIIDDFSIRKIYTFDERRTTFRDVIQEICILHIEKSKIAEDIEISYNGHTPIKCSLNDILLDNENNIILTPKDSKCLEMYNNFKKFPLGTIGKDIFFRPGKVVQFRVHDKLNNLKPMIYKEYENGIPLLVYRHINKEKFEYDEVLQNKKNKAITIINNGISQTLLIKNVNYLLIKKNVDKGKEHLFKAVPYFKELKGPKQIAIDNGLAYITNEKDNLTKTEILGINCVFFSKQFEDYYFMINSNHAINVYELKNMHFPDLKTLREIGREVLRKIKDDKVSPDLATKIFSKYLNPSLF